jgi:hypothetical protein
MDPQNLAMFVALTGDILIAIDRFTTLAAHLFPLQTRIIGRVPAPVTATSPELPSVG